MSKKKQHILPNGTKVNVLFEGSVVGTGVIIDHLLEPDDMYPSRQNLTYRVRIEPSPLIRMLDIPLELEHWLNDFELKPVK